MTEAAKMMTTLSTKGQVILPKALRDRRQWEAGTRLVVEDTPEGILLRREASLAPTEASHVFGMLKYDGPARTLADMNAAIVSEAARRHDRD